MAFQQFGGVNGIGFYTSETFLTAGKPVPLCILLQLFLSSL